MKKETCFVLGFLIGVLMMIAVAETAHGGDFRTPDNFFDKHEVTIGYAPWCEHIFSDKPDYNERNNHMFLVSVDQWWVSTFRNSNYDRSVAAGYNFRTIKWTPSKNDDLFLRGNLLLGLVYGYGDSRKNIAGLSLAGTLSGEIGYKNVSLHLAVLPVAAFMITYTF